MFSAVHFVQRTPSVFIIASPKRRGSAGTDARYTVHVLGNLTGTAQEIGIFNWLFLNKKIDD